MGTSDIGALTRLRHETGRTTDWATGAPGRHDHFAHRDTDSIGHLRRRLLTAAALVLSVVAPGVASAQTTTVSAPTEMTMSICDPTTVDGVVQCTHPEQTVEADFNNHDVYFSRYEALLPKQQALLKGYFHADSDTAASEQWKAFAVAHPDLAGTFLANTHALSKTFFELPRPPGAVSALDTVVSLQQIEDDRIIVKLDSDVTKPYYRMWTQEGGRYDMMWENGKVERGHIHMNQGDLSGSLHEGYDDQGYTSPQAPRIQWNVTMPSATHPDMTADIDIDYRTPWKGGIIPNPFHLAHDNSVVLDHYPTYTQRWGNPGFTLVKNFDHDTSVSQ